MAVSPFFNYGMYSEVIKVNEKYLVFEVIQNGKRLRGQDFTPEEWDKILLPLQYFSGISKSNELYEKDIQRLLNKVHLPSTRDQFLETCNYQEFENWYKEYLTQITNENTVTIAINTRTYLFAKKRLIETSSIIPLAQLCR